MTVRSLLGVILLFASFASSALAQESAKLTIDLNDIAEGDKGCRFTYVIDNKTEVALDEVSFVVSFFGPERKFISTAVLAFGAAPSQRTKVVQFELEGHTCADIVEVIENPEPAGCKSGGQENTICASSTVFTGFYAMGRQ